MVDHRSHVSESRLWRAHIDTKTEPCYFVLPPKAFTEKLCSQCVPTHRHGTGASVLQQQELHNPARSCIQLLFVLKCVQLHCCNTVRKHLKICSHRRTVAAHSATCTSAQKQPASSKQGLCMLLGTQNCPLYHATQLRLSSLTTPHITHRSSHDSARRRKCRTALHHAWHAAAVAPAAVRVALVVLHLGLLVQVAQRHDRFVLFRLSAGFQQDLAVVERKADDLLDIADDLGVAQPAPHSCLFTPLAR